MRQGRDVLVVHHTTKRSVGNYTELRGGSFKLEESNFSVLDEVEVVANALKELGLVYRVEGVKEISELHDVLSRSSEQVVFNLIEDLNGDALDFCYVPTVCKAYGKACTGGDTPSLLLAQDKWRTKAVLRAANLPTPDGIIVPVGGKIHSSKLIPGPYIVKPAFCDASEGIDAKSVVDLPGAVLNRAVERVHAELNQPAIVEQFIAGRELNVSLLERNDRVEVLPIAEIDFSAFGKDYPHIVDYSAKWLRDSFAYKNTPCIVPTRLADRVAKLVRAHALGAWHVLGCKDFARVDFRLDRKNRIFILEVNPNPDISPDAGFAAALAAGGISFAEFVKILVDNTQSNLYKNYPTNSLRHVKINDRKTTSKNKYSLHVSQGSPPDLVNTKRDGCISSRRTGGSERGT